VGLKLKLRFGNAAMRWHPLSPADRFRVRAVVPDSALRRVPTVATPLHGLPLAAPHARACDRALARQRIHSQHAFTPKTSVTRALVAPACSTDTAVLGLLAGCARKASSGSAHGRRGWILILLRLFVGLRAEVARGRTLFVLKGLGAFCAPGRLAGGTGHGARRHAAAGVTARTREPTKRKERASGTRHTVRAHRALRTSPSSQAEHSGRPVDARAGRRRCRCRRAVSAGTGLPPCTALAAAPARAVAARERGPGHQQQATYAHQHRALRAAFAARGTGPRPTHRPRWRELTNST